MPLAFFRARLSSNLVTSKLILLLLFSLTIKPCHAYARECVAGVGVSLGVLSTVPLPPIPIPRHILLNSDLSVFQLREEVEEGVGIVLIPLGTFACLPGRILTMPVFISPATSTILLSLKWLPLTFGLPPLNRLLWTRFAPPRRLLWSP